MPKAIVSAEEILGNQASEVAVEERAPVQEAEAPKESEAPAAGFESPPVEEAPVEEASAPAPAAVDPKGGFSAGMESVASGNAEELAAPTAADVLANLADRAEVEEAKLPPPPTPILNSLAPRPSDKSEGPKPSDKSSDKPEIVAPAPAAPSWRFVKNIHPGEKIFLKDGTEYPFPKQGVHTVTDPKVAEKLLEVAANYHIVQQ